MNYLHAVSANFKQSPACGKFLAAHQTLRRQVKALPTHSAFRLQPKGLGAISQKIGARHLALDQYGVTRALPADGVGHSAAYASLLGKHQSATIVTQPPDIFFNQLRMGHVGTS